jgi:hypothetical protein
MLRIFIFLLGLFLFPGFYLSGQSPQRPMIWVKPADKEAILQKIDEQLWAKTIYMDFINQLNIEVDRHQQNPTDFLKGMPFNQEEVKPGEIPPFLLTRHIENGLAKNLDNATDAEMAPARTLMRYLQTGVDCGIAYYLTDDEKYARCALDILYTFTKGVLQAELSDWRSRGGWLFPDDGFREVREIGYKVPLIYDFVAPFIQKGGKPFDFAKNSKAGFPQTELQKVLHTYATITVHYGHTGSNHSILEAPSLVYNALAMDDETERNKWLSYFLSENTENQDALNVMAAIYKNEGDIWPETSQYLNAAGSILTRLMLVVNKYDPSLRLCEKYPNLLLSLPALDYLVYPNGQLIRWGDGKRTGTPPFQSYEEAYLLGKMDGVEKITRKFAPLINSALKEGKYKRSGILAVLWFDDDYQSESDSVALPRTDRITHAGIFLQRNLSKTGDADDGLMCFVGGAHMVHGHAEGMNIELYGCGQVLGVDNGRGRYQQDIHENYSRLFAAHNTVIVNGNSRGDSGWVNLGINTVQLVAMEPMPREQAVSPYHSFSVTSFHDDKGDKAEAHQERTLALIRTSGTTGYYVDIFRSKSKLPNEFHDYLYHNIGDRLDFLNNDIKLTPTPERYMANASLQWLQNRQYRHPGWHFFDKAESSADYDNDVQVRFTAEKFKQQASMNLYIPGFKDREYTKVIAPPTFEAPDPYSDLPTPTLVIRKKGEAWNQPFVAVYEPFKGSKKSAGILSVEKLDQDGMYKGLKIISEIDDEEIIQYVITQFQNGIYQDEGQGIYFKGRFAVITLNRKGLQNIYIGEGEELAFGNVRLKPENKCKSAYMNYAED